MILVGELATLAMEIQIDKTGTFIFPGKTGHSVDSTNLTTIQSTLSNFNAEVEPAPHRLPNANAADAANSFVKEWEKASATNTAGQPVRVSSGNLAGSPPRSPASTQMPKHLETNEEALSASEELKLAELLDQWEGGEDRLDRKKVRCHPIFLKVSQLLTSHTADLFSKNLSPLAPS